MDTNHKIWLDRPLGRFCGEEDTPAVYIRYIDSDSRILRVFPADRREQGERVGVCVGVRVCETRRFIHLFSLLY